jgi:hypothetical protein
MVQASDFAARHPAQLMQFPWRVSFAKQLEVLTEEYCDRVASDIEGDLLWQGKENRYLEVKAVLKSLQQQEEHKPGLVSIQFSRRKAVNHLGRRGCTRSHGSVRAFDVVMRYKHLLKKVLRDNQSLWDVVSMPPAARDAFNKVLQCGTAALGAEVYSSGIEDRVVFHTCKGRECSSCGARATSQWQRERWAALPDVQYKGITFTMPDVLWPLFRNRKLAKVLSVLAAKTVEAWVRAKFGLKVGVIAIPHTFNGTLEFNAHVHVMVTAR